MNVAFCMFTCIASCFNTFQNWYDVNKDSMLWKWQCFVWTIKKWRRVQFSHLIWSCLLVELLWSQFMSNQSHGQPQLGHAWLVHVCRTSDPDFRRKFRQTISHGLSFLRFDKLVYCNNCLHFELLWPKVMWNLSHGQPLLSHDWLVHVYRTCDPDLALQHLFTCGIAVTQSCVVWCLDKIITMFLSVW